MAAVAISLLRRLPESAALGTNQIVIPEAVELFRKMGLAEPDTPDEPERPILSLLCMQFGRSPILGVGGVTAEEAAEWDCSSVDSLASKISSRQNSGRRADRAPPDISPIPDAVPDGQWPLARALERKAASVEQWHEFLKSACNVCLSQTDRADSSRLAIV